MGTRKFAKQIEQIVEDAGATLQDINHEKSGHYVMHLKAPDGRVRKLHCSGSPSCKRGILNLKSDIRKFVAGIHS